MEFFNVNNHPVSRQVTFETKTRATGVGFVSLGQRIRGLLSNNKLDLSGVNTSDDYDDIAEDGKWKDDDSLKYDESQDFLDKIDASEMIDNISEKVRSNISETMSNKKEALKNEQKSSDSSIQDESGAHGDAESVE